MKLLTIALAVLGLCLTPALLPAQVPEQPAAQVHQAYLGIRMEPGAAPAETGLKILVAPQGPAAQAGMKSGDVISKMDDKPVKELRDLVRTIREHKPGHKVKFEVMRDGKAETLNVTLGERPSGNEPAAIPRRDREAFLGVQAERINPALKQKFGFTADKGAVVMNVLPDSPAGKAGVKQGDVIVNVDGKAVADPEELRAAVRAAGAGKEVKVTILRGGEQKELTAQLQALPADGSSPIPVPGRGFGFRRANPAVLEAMHELEQKVDRLEKQVQQLEQKLNQPK
jgi:S1-C subfamily serine protease